MKRILVLAAIMAILVLAIMPTPILADGCCEKYPPESCCRQMCCDARLAWYRVSYLERVSSGYFNQGIEMTASIWTYQYVQAHDHKAAAIQIGMTAGHGCFVNANPP